MVIQIKLWYERNLYLFYSNVSSSVILQQVMVLNYSSLFNYKMLKFIFYSTKIVEKRLLDEILRQLNAVRLWFEEQRHFLFYATSLLLVYDAALLKESSNVLNVRIRMIDFAHVYPAQNSRDANYLEGLGKLIQIISSIV